MTSNPINHRFLERKINGKEMKFDDEVELRRTCGLYCAVMGGRSALQTSIIVYLFREIHIVMEIICKTLRSTFARSQELRRDVS
jgi:hypothetical protein